MKLISVNLLVHCTGLWLIIIFLFFLTTRQRMAGHIQVYALSKWLGVDLPVEYSQFTKGLQWSIPSLKLPWEKHQMKVSSGPPMDLIHDLGAPKDSMHDDIFTTIRSPKLHGVSLNPSDYFEFFGEVRNSYFYRSTLSLMRIF